jgi:predicted MFS family arabinose efflux permease
VATGWLLASSSLGDAGSIALAAEAGARFGYRAAFLACGAGPALGLILLSAALRPRPEAPAGRPALSPDSLRFLADRRSLLVTIGYAAHCWELLGMWAWMPAFLADAAGAAPVWVAAALHGSGGLAPLIVGRAADRLGCKPVLATLGLVGAACSFTIEWVMHEAGTIGLPLAALYGFAALGDSPTLTAAMAESVEAGNLASALAVRSILGSGAGGLAPLAFGAVLGRNGAAADARWGRGFAVLGLGGALAAPCVLLLPGDFDDTQGHTSSRG